MRLKNNLVLENFLIVWGLLLICQNRVNGIEVEESNDGIEFFLSRDSFQKQVYEFDSNVLKVVILDLQNQNLEFACNVRQQRISISTEPLASFNEEFESKRADLKNPLLFRFFNSAFIVVSRSGSITVFFQQQSLSGDSDNSFRVYAYPGGLEDGQVLLKAFQEGDFLFLISSKKGGYYMKTFVVSDLRNIRNVEGESVLVSDVKNNEKIICIRMLNDQLYLLNTDFVLFIFQIDKDYKQPKLLRKVHIQNLFLPLSFDIDDSTVYMIDKEKGVFSFNLTEITSQQLASQDLFLKVDKIMILQNNVNELTKPILSSSNDDYFLLKGKGQSHHFISEIQNEKLISTSIEEPDIKSIVANSNYITFISDDNIHIMHRGIDQNMMNGNEKKFAFEILDIQDVYLDNNFTNQLYILTLSEILVAKISKTQSSLVCYYNQKVNLKDQPINNSIHSFTVLQISQNDVSSSTQISQKETKVNVKIGQNIFEMNSSAFFMGFISGIIVLLIIVSIFLIHKRHRAKKIQKYHNFVSEEEIISGSPNNNQNPSISNHSNLKNN